jgi:LmbE family N-acetylglucosaminyl deacetylase
MKASELIAAMHTLALAPTDTIFPELQLKGNTVMIIAPHPDDETLGCGGMIAELCAKGRPPIVVIATDGSGSHPGSRAYPPERLRVLRAAEVARAVSILGLPEGNLHFLGMLDGAMPRDGREFKHAVEVLNQIACENNCRTICGPSWLDPHCDHETTGRMAWECAKAAGAKSYFYPVWSWLLASETELPEQRIAGWRVDVSARLDLKRRAIAAHASQFSDLIQDDPEGFRLPAELIEACTQPYEVLLEMHEREANFICA